MILIKSIFNIKNKISFTILLLIFISVKCYPDEKGKYGYIANQESISGIFNALSSVVKKPIIVSKNAKLKKISGEFTLESPLNLLDEISNEIGLIWYNDGQAIYVYDSSEIKSTVVSLNNITFKSVVVFLKNAGLYDEKYPLRSDNRQSVFYISAPPIYVDLILNAVKYLDKENENITNGQKGMVTIIPLYNTFVDDREYQYRNQKITIPGVSTVIKKIMSKAVDITENNKMNVVNKPKGEIANTEIDNQINIDELLDYSPNAKQNNIIYDDNITVISDPGSNSLLVRGDSEQISSVRKLIKSLDIPKRHIELSVWIVDLQKEAFDNLGVKWTGNINVGSDLGISLNGGTSTIDGASFMITALALSEKNQANIVSRPMILTQENIPAIFDNNRTFYSQVIGERIATLENVTYGTLISVLPRFTENEEVEMMLNIEDGNQFDTSNSVLNNLPEVGRTNISTIARVPKGKSLLIGGYTRDEDTKVDGKIPYLSDIPWIGPIFKYSQTKTSNMVRVFLIQPTEIDSPLSPDANVMINDMKKNLSSDNLQYWMTNYLESQK